MKSVEQHNFEIVTPKFLTYGFINHSGIVACILLEVLCEGLIVVVLVLGNVLSLRIIPVLF